MKIAILTQYPYDIMNVSGGVESSMLGLLKGLEKYDDLDIHIITISPKPEKHIISDKLYIHYIHTPKLPRLLASITIDQYRVKKKMKQLKPDLINAHMTAPLFGYPALQTGYPTIVTVHGIVSEESKTWIGIAGKIKKIIYSLMEREVLKKSKYLSVVSPYVESKIKYFTLGKCVEVIPNGVGEEFFHIESNNIPYRLLNVGGIEPRKGLLNLIKAILLIREELPQVELHIIGKIRDLIYCNILMNYVKSNNLEKNIIFSGNVSKEILMREIGECSVFVFPSQEESQGIVLLEAMAAGKPIVATNRGGIPFIVDNSQTGIIVEYGDINALKDAIMNLLNNKELNRKFGDAGREKARTFSSEKIASMYYHMYKNIFLYEKNNNSYHNSQPYQDMRG